MYLKILAIISVVLFASSTSAQTNHQVTADLFFELGESRYEAAGVLLRSASDYIERNESLDHDAGHEAFKRYIGNSPNFSALLAIDRDGSLLFDSFNERPIIRGMDLSNREYYTDLQRVGSASKPVVFPSIVGQQSGNILIPIAQRVPEIRETRARVVVTFLMPESLIPNVRICPACGMIVMKGSEVISSDKPVTSTNEAIAANLRFEGQYGAKTISVRGFSLRLHWRKSEFSDLTYVYYVGYPNRNEL